ncbi:hypothetical protein [Clostridium sp. CF012]|uniref:hypothetical protein n=1 Tax=Clostridium sp. CF012 TaxID=2843319 RepID=UPI001C0C7272|nr:hypothetical protein [Clostridium sp. CF012]MBU3144285.1 hypothetical protein [Clostridium sp. CF012]
MLNQNYVYAKGVTHEGTEIISILGAPTLLTAVEIYKVRSSIKIYMKNLKLITRKNDK